MPMPGGNFGPIRPHILRNIRIIGLLVKRNLRVQKDLSGHRNFLRLFVEAINAHTNDSNHLSLLKEL
jgi:hypothetical protein